MVNDNYRDSETVMMKIDITLLCYYNAFWSWFFPNLGIRKCFRNLRHWMATQTFWTTNTFIEGTIHLSALLDLWGLGTPILYALNECCITWHWEAAVFNRINLEHKWRQNFDQWSIRQYFVNVLLQQQTNSAEKLDLLKWKLKLKYKK